MSLTIKMASCMLAVIGWVSAPALACSRPPPPWQPPTIEERYRVSEVVVHVQVVSSTSDRQGASAKIKVIRVFKGDFDRDIVYTGDHGQCGIGEFRRGEYVFFLKKGQYNVDNRSIASESTEHTLQQIQRLSLIP